jgi:cell wall-associated NlpC family hydrolase
METAVIRVSVAPLMAARSTASEQVSQALLGASVVVLEATGRWARVRMEDDYEGWLSRAHLAHASPPAMELVTVTDLWVNLRTRPDYRMPARILACVGSRLPLIDRRPGWLGVALPAGGAGWLEEHRGQVHGPEGFAPRADPGELLETARRFLGVPYLWGGCSPFGLDCSGFVQLVYRLHGARLPRDAGDQAREGEVVLLEAAGPEGCVGPGPGDAVFFHGPDATERITHVGLSLGDGSFIHAAGSDQVRVNRLADAPYAQRLVGARRYLDASASEARHSARGLA